MASNPLFYQLLLITLVLICPHSREFSGVEA
jgi:hypothetical protein